MKKIFLLFFFCISAVSGDEIPFRETVTLFYSGKIGKQLRDLPEMEKSGFSLQKRSPQQIADLLKRGILHIALCEGSPAVIPEQYEVQRFAVWGMILAVNPENPLVNVSLSMAKELLYKSNGNWKYFGGPPMRIRLYVKNGLLTEASPPKRVLEQPAQEKSVSSPQTIEEYRIYREQFLPSGKKKPVKTERTEHRVLKLLTPSDEKTFSLLFTDRWGIGVFNLTRFDENRLGLLRVEQMAPTLDNFRSGVYPLMTSFYLITKRTLSPREQKLRAVLESKAFAKKLFAGGFLVFPPAKKSIKQP